MLGLFVPKLKVPEIITDGAHRLTVEALVPRSPLAAELLVADRAEQRFGSLTFSSGELFHPIFHNETALTFSAKHVSVFVVMDSPEYMTPSTGQSNSG